MSDGTNGVALLYVGGAPDDRTAKAGTEHERTDRDDDQHFTAEK